MKKLLLLFSIISFSIFNVNACSCSGESSFCNVNSTNPTFHVFIGKILSHDSLFTQFQIIERIKGAEINDTIIIWDEPDTTGTFCSGANSQDMGSIGDSILITLPKINSLYSQIAYANVGDYLAPSNFCSKPYLPVKNQMIIGNITVAHPYTAPPTPYIIDSIYIADFKADFDSSPNANNCDLFVGLTKTQLENIELELYPNPSSNGIVELKTNQKITSARIYSVTGKEIEVNLIGYTVDLSQHAKGVYFITVEMQNGNRASKKIIIK